MDGQDPHADPLRYADFELEIGPGDGTTYPVAVLRSPAGEARGTMQFPFVGHELERQTLLLERALLRGSQRVRGLGRTTEEGTVRAFGQKLYDALFAGAIGHRYDASLSVTQQGGLRLRIKLRFAAPDLAAVPWEFLYDADHLGDYLSLSRAVSLVRYPERPYNVPALTVQPPLRILGIAASPDGTDELDLDMERKRVEEALGPLRDSGLAAVTWLARPTWRELQGALRRPPWHVLHYVGHGGYDEPSGEGYLVLEQEGSHRSRRLYADELARLLAGYPDLRLVVLNACEGAVGSPDEPVSSVGAALARRGVPAVLAMQYEITDEAGIEFGRTFYESLADNLPIDAALSEARIALSVAGLPTLEWGTPVLYMRSSSGRLFDVAAAPAAARTHPAHDESQVAGSSVAEPARQAPNVAPPPQVAADAADVARTEPPEEPAASRGPTEEAVNERLDALYTEGLSALADKRWDRAVELLGQVVAQLPDNRDAAGRLVHAQRQQRLAHLYEEAEAASATRSWGAAIERLEAVQALDANYRDAATLLERARREKTLADLYDEARRRYQEGDWQAVVEAFDRLTAITGTGLGSSVRDPDRLLTRARKALANQERRERDAERLYTQGTRHAERGEWPEAVAKLEELERLAPEYRDVQAQLTRARQEQTRAMAAASPPISPGTARAHDKDMPSGGSSPSDADRVQSRATAPAGGALVSVPAAVFTASTLPTPAEAAATSPALASTQAASALPAPPPTPPVNPPSAPPPSPESPAELVAVAVEVGPEGTPAATPQTDEAQPAPPTGLEREGEPVASDRSPIADARTGPVITPEADRAGVPAAAPVRRARRAYLVAGLGGLVAVLSFFVVPVSRFGTPLSIALDEADFASRTTDSAAASLAVAFAVWLWLNLVLGVLAVAFSGWSVVRRSRGGAPSSRSGPLALAVVGGINCVSLWLGPTIIASVTPYAYIRETAWEALVGQASVPAVWTTFVGLLTVVVASIVQYRRARASEAGE